MRRERGSVASSSGHPCPWWRLFTAVCLYSAEMCFPPPSSPIILSSPCWFGLCGFSPFALTRTAGRGLENEGVCGGCTFMASSLIMSLQVWSFICWTGFDSIHPPRAWGQAFNRESRLWLRLLKLSWTRLCFWRRKKKKKIKSKCVNLRGEINKAEYPFFLNCRFKGFHEKLTTPMM